MSNFSGRRAPNVSQYLANLNTIPSQQELSAQQTDFDLGNDGLDFLTNTEFFDFDASALHSAQNVDFMQQAQQQQQQSGKNNARSMNAPSYQFSEFQTYPPSMVNSPVALPPSPPNGLQGAYPPQAHHFTHATAGDKRKASVANIQPAIDLEEASRNMAEEDKRRRNTAASARFRVKKKQREQALEKAAKEMTDKVSSLEGKIQQLEMENKWLKGLITEKSGAKGMEEQFKLFKADKAEEKEAERSTELRTDGVGTEEDEEEEIEA